MRSPALAAPLPLLAPATGDAQLTSLTGAAQLMRGRAAVDRTVAFTVDPSAPSAGGIRAVSL